MFKVPKSIEKAMEQMQNHSKIVSEKDFIIREWLFENNMLNDHALDLLIDTCNHGQGSIQELINLINEDYDIIKKKGNTYEV